MSQKALSYDLGGTKLAAAIVNARGQILDQIWVQVNLEKGKEAVIQQLADLGKVLLEKYPETSRIGVASAGPLDPKKGELLDPTNFVNSEGSWGKVPLSKILKRKLKLSVYLENDAAAAALAENWIGASKGYQNAISITLGTGLGTGIICNGKLTRAGRHLHPEAGHQILRANDSSAICACGNLGCAEAYLSGNGFARRAAHQFNNPLLTAKQVTELARQGDIKAQQAFEEFAELMSVAIQNYIRIFCPEIIVFTGSFAAASDVFMPKVKEHLQRILKRQRKGTSLLPKLTLSTLNNEAGLIGGAYIAFHPEEYD